MKIYANRIAVCEIDETLDRAEAHKRGISVVLQKTDAVDIYVTSRVTMSGLNAYTRMLDQGGDPVVEWPDSTDLSIQLKESEILLWAMLFDGD